MRAILPIFASSLSCLNGFRIRSPLVQKGFGEIVELIAYLAFLQNRAQGPLARIITFRTPPLVHPSLPRKPSRNVRVPTDGYHLSGCTWGNGPAGQRKVARRTRNIKHDRRGERQMPDPGRQHRGRRAFRPQPNIFDPRQRRMGAFTFCALAGS